MTRKLRSKSEGGGGKKCSRYVRGKGKKGRRRAKFVSYLSTLIPHVEKWARRGKKNDDAVMRKKERGGNP